MNERERFGIGEAFTRMENGEAVVALLPDRYPLPLKLLRGNTLMERVSRCWYPCRKGAATLAAATYIALTDHDEAVPDVEPPSPRTVDERLRAVEQALGL